MLDEGKNIVWFAMSTVFFNVMSHAHFRYVGSFSGLMYVFALPALVYMKKEDMNGRLTTAKKVFHFAIVVIGCMNLIAQFLI